MAVSGDQAMAVGILPLLMFGKVFGHFILDGQKH